MANNKVDNVDTRVVEMQFDNKQFEKGADKTLTTLEKLKNALKFENANKGFDSLQKSIDGLNLNGLTKQVSGIESAFNSLTGSLKRNFFDRISNEILNLGKQLYTVTAGQIVSGGKTRAMNIAQSKFKMEGMGVTWDQIKNDLDYAVSGTAYGLDAAATIASQLVASGVTVGDSMRTALRGVSGVAAMTSSSYEEIGQVFAAVAGQGKAMAMQLNQLSLRGINAAATIGEYLGITEAEVRDMASKGQISFEIFSEAMDEAFGEHAKEANKTFTGAASNIRAALSKIGELFYGPFYDAMITPLNTIRETISMVKDALVGGLEYLDTKYGLKTTAERLEQILHVAGDIADILLKGIQNGIRNNLDKLQYLNKFLIIVLRNLKSIRDMLITLAEKSLAKSIAKSGGKYYNDTVNNLAKIGGSYKNVAKYIEEYNTSGLKLTDTLTNTSKTAKKQITIFSVLSNVLYGIFSIVQGGFNIAKQVLKIIIAIGYAFGKVFISFGKTGAKTIGELIINFSEFIKKLNISEVALNAVYTISYGLFTILKTLGTAIMLVVKALGGMGEILGDVVGVIALAVYDVASLIVGFVRFGKESKLFEIIAFALHKAISSIVGALNALRSIDLSKATLSVKNFFNGLYEVLTKRGYLNALKYIYTEFRRFIDFLVPIIKSFKRIPATINHTFKTISALVYPFIKQIGEWFSHIHQLIRVGWNKISCAIQKKKGADAGLVAITSTVQSFADAFVHTTEATGNMIDAVASMVNAMSSTLSKTGEKLNEQDPKPLKEGIQKVSMSFTSIGGLFSSIENISGEAKDSVTKTIENVAAINNMIVSDIAAIAFYNISLALKKIGGGVAAVGDLLSMIKKAVKKISAAEAFKRASEGFIALGIAIGVFVGVIVATAFALEHLSDSKYLWSSILLVSGVMLVIGVLMTVLSGMANWHGASVVWGAAVIVGSIATALIAFLLVITFAAKKIQEQVDSGTKDMILDILLSVSEYIQKISVSMAVLSLVVYVVYLLAQKFKLNSDNTAEVIEAAGHAMTRLGASLLMLSIAMAIIGTIDADKFKKVESLLTTMLVSMMILSGIFIGLGKATSNAETFENAATLLKQMTTSLVTMLIAVAIISTAFSVLGASGNTVGINSVILAITLVTGIFGILAFAIVQIEKNAQGLSASGMDAITSLIKTFTVSLIAILVTIVGMTALFAELFDNYDPGQVVAALLLVGLVLFTALSAVYSAVSSVYSMSTESNKVANFKIMAKAIAMLATCLLSISVSIAILTTSASLSPVGFAAAVGTLVLMMAIVFAMYTGLMVTATKLGYNVNELEKLSESFAIMAASLVSIALAMTILVIGLQGTIQNSPAENLEILLEILGLMLGSVMVLGGMLLALTAAAQKFSKGTDAIKDVSVGFAYIASSMSILILALSMLAQYGSELYYMDDIMKYLIGIIVTIGIVMALLMYVQSKHPNANSNAWVIGRQLAGAMIAIGLAAIAVAGAAKIVEKAKVKEKTMDQMTDVLKSILNSIIVLFVVIAGFDFAKDIFSKGSSADKMSDIIFNSLLGITMIVLALGGAALTIAEAVKKMEKPLSTLEDAPVVIGIVFGVFAALIGSTLAAATIGGAEAGQILATFSAVAVGIVEVAGALFVLALAVAAFAAAVRIANGESLDEILHGVGDDPDAGLKDVTNKTLVALKQSGYITGREYAEGFRRGLWDQQGKLTDAGIAAGLAVNDGAKEATDEHSPSKVAEEIGRNFDIGLANGVEDNADIVKKQSKKLAYAMTGSLTTALDRMQIDASAAENAATTMAETIHSNIVEANDGFGDFKFDYSSIFDDAPFEPTISPIIDASQVEGTISAEPTTELDLSESMAGLSDSLSNLDLADSLGGLLTDDEGNNFLETIAGSLTGEDEETDPLDTESLSSSLFGDEGLDGLLSGFTSTITESLGFNIDDIIAMIGNGGLLGGLKDIFLSLQESGPLGKLVGSGFLSVMELMQLIGAKDFDLGDFLFGNFTGFDPTAEQSANDFIWHQTADGETLRFSRIANDVKKWKAMGYYDSSTVNSPYDIPT